MKNKLVPHIVRSRTTCECKFTQNHVRRPEMNRRGRTKDGGRVDCRLRLGDPGNSIRRIMHGQAVSVDPTSTVPLPEPSRLLVMYILYLCSCGRLFTTYCFCH